mmetsp:Transcript_9551/g.21112  ORF Transcript_9551/g.21112 Transcript_9551/m.21112 type:complete len:88 (-) Transcript_9551:600-863(-)
MGLSHTSLHCGFAHSFGLRQFHKHCGGWHTFWHGSMPLHFKRQIGLAHCVLHLGDEHLDSPASSPLQASLGQKTVQCGVSQSIAQSL